MDAPASVAVWSAEFDRRAALDRPRLSVVVVNYVRWDDTARLIRQLRRSSSFGREAEVVVVDNHSPPHPIIPRLRRADGVSLRRWRRNHGFARAVNEGCRLARGEWLLLLNPDVSVPNGFLDTVLARAEGLRYVDPRCGIAGFRLANDDGSWQLSTGRFPTLLGTLAGPLWPRHLRKYTVPPGNGRAHVDWVTGCCLLVRRDCWRDLGGLDERFFLYYEDVDLCKRAAGRGWSVWYDPAVTITHHRPLHLRQVPPHVRLITRHALLSYAGKHWPRWQTSLLAQVVRCEARLGGPWGDEIAAVAADLLRGDEKAARCRLLRAVRLYEEGRGRASVDRHPVAQSARLAGGVPGQRPPARAGAETLVVDDASERGCVGDVARAAGVAVLRLPSRGGFCVAANAGVAAVTGDVVEVLNDDVETSRNWAAAALRRFADPTVGAVTPLVLLGPPGAHSPERIDSGGDEYHLGGVARKRWHGEELAERHLVAGPVFGANGAGSFYRREALLAAGGFPEDFVAYFDDVDLSFRLRRAGWRVWYEPASRMHHRVSSSYGRVSGDLLALQSRNEELVFWRNVPAWQMPLALPLHLAVLGAKGLLRLREGRLRPFLRGRAQALARAWHLKQASGAA